MASPSLTEDDLFRLINELDPVRAKWYTLGLGLGVAAPDLQAIRTQYSNPSDCLCETLSIWVKQVRPRPTWSKIVSVLRSPALSEGTLAEKLEGLHCHSRSDTSTECGNQKTRLSAGTVVDEKDVGNLLQLLDKKAASWDLFTQHLGVPHDVIEKIEHDFGRRCSKCLSEAVHWWVSNGDDPTYEKISTVLRGPVVTDKQLAKRVDQFKVERAGDS